MSARAWADYLATREGCDGMGEVDRQSRRRRRSASSFCQVVPAGAAPRVRCQGYGTAWCHSISAESARAISWRLALGSVWRAWTPISLVVHQTVSLERRGTTAAVTVMLCYRPENRSAHNLADGQRGETAAWNRISYRKQDRCRHEALSYHSTYPGTSPVEIMHQLVRLAVYPKQAAPPARRRL